jgi:hypothetical protein
MRYHDTGKTSQREISSRNAGENDLDRTIEKYRHDRATIQEATRVSRLSTFSDEEVESLMAAVKRCRTRFTETHDGLSRVKCLCSVLREAKEGNGGTLPEIDDWENIYHQLDCQRSETGG